jgi:hypothetical protein
MVFPTPLHWLWRAPQPTHWFASPNGRTFVSLTRMVRGEPVRISGVTLFAEGGSCITACPGFGLRTAEGPHVRQEVQGVGLAELLDRHEQEVTRVATARGVPANAGSLGDVVAFIDASFVWPPDQAGYAVLPLGFFGLPAALVWPAFLQGDRSRILNALPILGMGLLYATLRYAYLRMFDRRLLRTHTRAFQLEQEEGAPGPEATS